MKSVTHKQQNFIKEYLSSGNATLAAQLAYGIKKKSVASATGSRLLRNVKIQKKISESLAKEDIDVNLILKSLKKNLIDGAGVQAKASDSNRAGEILLKYLDKKDNSKNTYNQYNVTAMFANLSISEALEKRNELNQWFEEIIN